MIANHFSDFRIAQFLADCLANLGVFAVLFQASGLGDIMEQGSCDNRIVRRQQIALAGSLQPTVQGIGDPRDHHRMLADVFVHPEILHKGKTLFYGRNPHS